MDRMSALEALTDAAHVSLGRWQVRYPEYHAMGVLCSYVPEEMVHAAGLTPVRIRRTDAPLRRVDEHLQSFTCALCRSALDQAVSGELGGFEGTVFAHTCDAMQALADLWRMNAEPSRFLDTVMAPANLGSPAARAYLVAELVRFRGHLEAYTGRPIDDRALGASIGVYDESRRLVQALAGHRERLSAPHFFAILDAAQAMPRELFNPLLAGLLEEIESLGRRATGPRLFLVGAILDEPLVPTLIEELGAQVVGDDLCSGSRHFHGQVGTQGDPIANLADYFLRRPPCPAKLSPSHDPGLHLLGQVRGAGADGVVLLEEKYCEPHAFEHALLRPALERAEVPFLVLEMEQTPSPEGLRTRLQAFVEML